MTRPAEREAVYAELDRLIDADAELRADGALAGLDRRHRLRMAAKLVLLTERDIAPAPPAAAPAPRPAGAAPIRPNPRAATFAARSHPEEEP